MAKKKHRKLFPILTSETNKTIDCSIGICDPICPYNCYQEPDYYSISPQQPPWSSPHPITSPSITVFYQEPQNSSSSSLDSISIIIVTGAVIAILLTSFLLVAKFVSDRVNRVNHARSQDENEETFEEGFQDHPIWLIRTIGLQPSIIKSIKICTYKKGDGLIVETDCAVCLSEFEEDERLRLLPKCNHAFHISCIDTWLRSHTNCPLCRAAISGCSGLVDVAPGGSEENDGVGEDGDLGEIENGGELVREMDQSGYKERLDNVDLNSEVRIEIYGFGDEINRSLEEIDGDGSETEMEEKVRVFGDFFSQEKETENRDIGASCSEENNGESRRSSDSVDSGESNGEATEDIGTM